MSDTARGALMEAVAAELDHAYAKHGRKPWGRHEFYAILREEVDELWDAIKADEPQERVIAELTQVAAMCFRYAETGDAYRGPHPGFPARPRRRRPPARGTLLDEARAEAFNIERGVTR